MRLEGEGLVEGLEVQPLERKSAQEGDQPLMVFESQNVAWKQVVGWGIVGIVSLALLPKHSWLIGVLPFGIILPLFHSFLAISQGRVRMVFHQDEVHSVTNSQVIRHSYLQLRLVAGVPRWVNWGFNWRLKSMRGMDSLSASDLEKLPAEDLMLLAMVSRGVSVTNSPWGTMKASEPVSAGSIAWRQRGDSKWILALPGIFLLTVAVYIFREPALDDVLAWVLGGIGALWLAVWLSLSASQRGVKGLLEFKDQGLRVTARGQVLSEIDFADLKRFEIQTRTGSLGRREKRIVALTHYAREVPMTDWLTTWDSAGEFVISQALKRGHSIGFEGLRDQEALPDE